MKFPPSKTIILGILFVLFLFFIVYSLMNSNPIEGMHGATATTPGATHPTTKPTTKPKN
jgi:hypothetical protein